MSNTFTLGYLEAFTKSLEAILGQNPWSISAKELVDKLIEFKDDTSLQLLIKSQQREFRFFLIEKMKERNTEFAVFESFMKSNFSNYLDAARSDRTEAYKFYLEIRNHEHDSGFLKFLQPKLGDDFFKKPVTERIQYLNSFREDKQFSNFLIVGNKKLTEGFIKRIFLDEPDNMEAFSKLMQHRFGDRVFENYAQRMENGEKLKSVWNEFRETLQVTNTTINNPNAFFVDMNAKTTVELVQPEMQVAERPTPVKKSGGCTLG